MCNFWYKTIEIIQLTILETGKKIVCEKYFIMLIVICTIICNLASLFKKSYCIYIKIRLIYFEYYLE